MSVTDITSRVQYVASAAQTTFLYTFKIFEDADLKVYLTPVGQESDPTADILTLNTDYTVTGAGSDTGGTIILIIPATLNDIITIERDVIGDRPPAYDFQVDGEFTAAQLNENLDKITMLIQQNETLIRTRMLLYAATDQIDVGQTALPKLSTAQIWTANSLDNLVAGTIEESDGWSTLRSELASQTQPAPGTDNVGMYDTTEPGGKTLTTFFGELASQSVGAPGTDKIGAYDIDDSTGKTLTVLLNKLLSIQFNLPTGYISGFQIERDAGDPDHDIKFGKGSARGENDLVDLILSSPLVKQIDNPWAAGTNQGGFPSGLTLTANKWYHLFVIGKTDGTTDAGFDTSITATNLLADATGYTDYKRRLSIYTGATSNIRDFQHTIMNHQNIVIFKDSSQSIVSGPVPTTLTIANLTGITPDINVKAIMDVSYEVSGNFPGGGVHVGYLTIHETFINDFAPSISKCTLSAFVSDYGPGGTETTGASRIEVLTDGATNNPPRIVYRKTETGVVLSDALYINIIGWVE